MGGIIRSLGWWWNYFKDLFHIKNYYISGSITLSAGFHQIEIPTDFEDPVRVFLNVQEPEDEIPTCVGHLNWVAAKIQVHGFTLFADVKTESCVVKYVVEYSSEKNNPNGPIVFDENF